MTQTLLCSGAKPKREASIQIIYVLFPLFVITAKIIRHTIMKTVLVDAGIGHLMLPNILAGNIRFLLFETTGTMDASGNASYLFSFLRFGAKSYLEFETVITILWNLIILSIMRMIKKSLTIGQISFLALSILVLNIFDFTLAKEPIQMLYFLAMYYVLKSNSISIRGKSIWTFVILTFSIITFRTYYVIIVYFLTCVQFIGWLYMRKQKRITFLRLLGITLLIGVFYYILLSASHIISPDNYDELIRVRTRTSTAASDIRTIVPVSNQIVFALNYLATVLRMLFPLELIWLGVKYIPYVLYQLVITALVFLALKGFRKNSAEKNLALFVFFGFLFASASFEPDFGSWVRHEAVTFPLLLLIADIAANKSTIHLHRG